MRKLSLAPVKSWDGNPDNLPGEAVNLRNFLDVNATHWFISLVNGGDGDLPVAKSTNRPTSGFDVKSYLK